MHPKQLLERQCVCGCGASFRSTRSEDLYASQACEELFTALSPRAKRERANQRLKGSIQLDPRLWLTATEIAQRLGRHPSAITHWTKRGWIPCIEVVRGQKRYRMDEVVEALARLRPKPKKPLDE